MFNGTTAFRLSETTYGIFESTDGGAHWTVRKGTTDQLHGATDIDIDPQAPNVLYASFWGDAIYKSTDAGVTWTPIMNGFPAGADFATGQTRFSLGLSHPAGRIFYGQVEGLKIVSRHQKGIGSVGGELIFSKSILASGIRFS